MIPITVEAESVDTNGALAIVHAASDELLQRYGGDGDNKHLNVDELRPPLGLFIVARHGRHLVVAADFARSPTPLSTSRRSSASGCDRTYDVRASVSRS